MAMKKPFQGVMFALSACAVTLLIIGCQSFGNLKSDYDQANALKKLKRGSLSSDGLYKNDYYEFDLQLPKGWSGSPGNPPVILIGTPPSKAFPDASARKFVDIRVMVQTTGPDDTLDTIVTKYFEQNAYTKRSSKSGFVMNAESIFFVCSGNWKGNPVHVMGLVVFREQKSIIIQCRALRPLFDNVEAQFRYSLRTFIVTAKDLAPVEPKGTPDPFDWKTDNFICVSQPGETVENLADQYMGKEEYAKAILQLNELDQIPAGTKLKIPRYLTCQIKEGDTWDSIAEKILGNKQYATWIKQYNSDTEWSVGSEIHVPLYRMEKVNAREGYLDFASRVYHNNRYSDLLLIYNDSKHLSLLKEAKIPLFLFAQYYLIRVQSGDTLAYLSSYYTGDPNNYRKIAELNKIPRPYKLSAGQMIRIPANIVKDPDIIKKPRPKQRPVRRQKPETKSVEEEEYIAIEVTPTPAVHTDEMTEIYEPF